MKLFAALLAASSLLLLAPSARATIQVGDQAKLTYQTVDGKTVDMEKLHGKMVVVDFWATWCGPCMAEAGHMVSINQKYGEKGLIMLGVSLDSDKASMLAVCKEKGFVWPQYFDGQGWSNALWKQWGSRGIPFTVLVDPTGKVAYAGHPAGGLDAAIEQTFKSTPPFLVDPSVVASATKVLDQVEELLNHKDARGAVKLLGKIPPTAKSDVKFAERSKEVQTKLEAASESLLTEAESLVSAGSYPEAVKSLRELSEGLTGLPAGTKARKDLSDLLSKPEAKAALAKAEKDAREADRNARAMEVLSIAQRLQADKKDDQAYAKFKVVVKDWAGTDAATTAAAEIKNYDQTHPELAQKANDSVASAKARAALSMAKNYFETGHPDLAKAKYQSIVTTFPHTEYAEAAKKALRDLGE